MARAIVRVPPKAKPGEIISVRTLIQHKMETGFRYTTTGEPIPRDIITRFVAAFDGEEIYVCELSPAIAANPFIAFPMRVEKSGTLRITWMGDNGFSVTEEARITVG